MECVNDRKKAYRCKSCKWCGNPSNEDSPSLRNWCSVECRQKYNPFGAIERQMRRMTLTRLNKIAQCRNCKLAFVKKQKTQIFCSEECSKESGRKSKSCVLCGKRFDVVKSKSRERKYCSTECANKHKKHLYTLHSSPMQIAKEERKARISEAKTMEDQSRRRLHQGWSCCIFCGNAVYSRLGPVRRCQSKQCNAIAKRLGRGASVKSFTCICCNTVFSKLTTANSILYCSEACMSLEARLKRRARIKATENYESGVTWRFVAKKFDWVCQSCGCVCAKPKGQNLTYEATLDHIIPLAKGGDHTKQNAQLLCRRCNSAKRDTMPAPPGRG